VLEGLGGLLCREVYTYLRPAQCSAPGLVTFHFRTVSVSGCKLGQRPTRTETRAKAPKLNARLTFAHSGSSLRYCIPRNESDGDQIPSLSWNYVPIKTQADNLVWDPVLAFGWGTNVRFMQLVDRGDDKPVNFKTLGTFTSKVKIISIRWLSERVIMTMDRQVIAAPPPLPNAVALCSS
jgi:hypothetical protein